VGPYQSPENEEQMRLCRMVGSGNGLGVGGRSVIGMGEGIGGCVGQGVDCKGYLSEIDSLFVCKKSVSVCVCVFVLYYRVLFNVEPCSSSYDNKGTYVRTGT
jgi:hypothetical protein